MREIDHPHVEKKNEDSYSITSISPTSHNAFCDQYSAFFSSVHREDPPNAAPDEADEIRDSAGEREAGSEFPVDLFRKQEEKDNHVSRASGSKPWRKEGKGNGRESDVHERRFA